MWNIVAHIQSFFFFIKTKKIIFLEVTMTIGENTSSKCLQCIKYDNSPRKSLMWKNVVLYLFSPNIGLFVHSWSPPSLKGDGPSKNLIIWEVPTILLERGITLKMGGVDVEMGGCHFFITLMFNCIYCVWRGKVKFPLLHFGSSVFWVNHARFSSKSFYYYNILSFAYFWSILMFTENADNFI